jgi:ferritin-like metal-binding protein YciE
LARPRKNLSETGLAIIEQAAANGISERKLAKANTFANRAFENYEIAAYMSLLVIGEAAGQSGHLTGFEQSLKEEQTIADLVKPTTLRYLELTTSGAKADR